MTAAVVLLVVIVGLYVFWRYHWFFRNPDRSVPAGDNIVCPADGTVVYVKSVEPDGEVLCVKQGVVLTIKDILRHDVSQPKVVIGVFMSPFDVHYNRAPLSGTVDFIRKHAATGGNRNMGMMHLRTILGMAPYYEGSIHIAQNERTVTRMSGDFKGERIAYYLVQIAGMSVNGIDSYVDEGDSVAKGQVFGMIRIGSQVDLIIPRRSTMNIRVKPGDRVYAGESILIE